jgi:hypothetical protein
VTAFSDLIREYATALKAACGGQDRYVLAGMALGIKSRDWAQASARCIASRPPLLGAALNADNVETLDFVVDLSIAGPLHEQISDLPPGTRISGLTFAGDST